MSTAVANTKVRRPLQERLLEAANGRPAVGVKRQPGYKPAKIGIVPNALAAIAEVETLKKYNPNQTQRAQILAALQSALEQLTEVFSDKVEEPANSFKLQS
jgi:hypothetical protein